MFCDHKLFPKVTCNSVCSCERVCSFEKNEHLRNNNCIYLRQFSSLAIVFLSDSSIDGVFSGERTFGVLTKIDLMDKGTDAVEVSKLAFFF